ncbi:U1 small nuclear ribonucleoprotein C [Colletotrichum fioriniae]|uniref:U1 small nuclear ribonucleoprotein C n=1 Tax=Colletotrichum fioriniae TaxID=710243 RepID=UPI0032DAA440|nr:U1 small nuclear ribonucleoprotein C [Colletotrichum fioriniae]
MPKFFCDYCDVYLTHDSMSVRKAHNSGRNHLRNVVDYYQQIGHEKAQSVIDSITSSYAAEGQAHNNPMLPQNQPGSAFPPPFPFPGGSYSPPYPFQRCHGDGHIGIKLQDKQAAECPHAPPSPRPQRLTNAPRRPTVPPPGGLPAGLLPAPGRAGWSSPNFQFPGMPGGGAFPPGPPGAFPPGGGPPGQDRR